MQYKSERSQLKYPISNVVITRDENIITHITVEIEGSNFDYQFEDSTEIQIIAKVLTGRISPREGYICCCKEYYSWDRDTKSYPSAQLLRFKLDNSQECKPFVSGNIFNEIEPYIGNLPPSSYNFRM